MFDSLNQTETDEQGIRLINVVSHHQIVFPSKMRLTHFTPTNIRV